ncbi:MAG: nucleotidyltransferase domain-containing protein [Desulfurivibrionaceae bacterium]
METIIEKCKQTLQEHYGDQFQGLYLYGSMARDQGDESSDIDLLVLLGKPFQPFEELRTIVNLLYPIQMDSDKLISAKPVAADEFRQGKIHLYRVVKREGKAA